MPNASINTGAKDQQTTIDKGDFQDPEQNDNVPKITRYNYSIKKGLDKKKLKKYRNRSYISVGVAIIAFAFGLFFLIKS